MSPVETTQAVRPAKSVPAKQGTVKTAPGARPAAAAAKKGNDPPRFLKIADSQVAKAPVHVTAGYTGDIGEGVFTEFKRRYGHMDYVVLQTRDPSGTPTGRVYAWNGKSAGVNSALLAAPAGARGQVSDASCKVLYEGEVIVKHDFEQAISRKEFKSPDGRYTAKLCEAGFPGLNFVIVQDNATGKEVTWQAGSRNGDLYLDAQWVGNALLTYEGKPEDQMLLQTHDDGHFVSEVLGPSQLVQDAGDAGLEIDPDKTPRVVATRPGGPTLQYIGEFVLTSGERVRKTFEGRFETGSDGFVHLVDRRPQ